MRRLAHAAERLDGPLDDPAVLAGNLRDLARVNRQLGGAALSRRALEALAGRGADRGATVRLLDVGTGAGDIPLALLRDWQRAGRRLEVVGVDRPEVLAAARAASPGIEAAGRLTLVPADALALPFEDGSFDVVHASLVLHHLDQRPAVGLLREMARVAARGVIVNDLSRGRVFWLGAWLLAHVATRNAYTRHDAPLSVRRAWSIREARALLAVAQLRPVVEARGPLGHRWVIGAAVR